MVGVVDLITKWALLIKTKGHKTEKYEILANNVSDFEPFMKNKQRVKICFKLYNYL